MFLSYCHVLWWFCHCYLYFDKMASRKNLFLSQTKLKTKYFSIVAFWQNFKEFVESVLTMIHQNIQILIYLQTNKIIQMKFVLVINNTSSNLTKTSFSYDLQHTKICYAAVSFKQCELRKQCHASVDVM